MKKANDANTSRHTAVPHFRLLYWLVLSILLPSAAVAGIGWLHISRPASHPGDKTSGLIATGSTYKVVVHKTSILPKARIAVIGAGKIPLPLPVVGVGKYEDRGFKTVKVKVDDPSLVEIVGRQGNVITLRGKAPGSTTLHVKARTKLGITQKAKTAVGSVVPDGVQLEPKCDGRAEKQRPLLAAAGREINIVEELHFGKKPILSDNFPPVEFGAFTPVPRKDGKDMWKSENLLGSNFLTIKAPATAMMTSLKVPAYGYELPVKVYEPSAVSGVRLSAPEKMTARSRQLQFAKIEILVGGKVPCIRPSIPLDLTIGPASVCSLHSSYKGTKTASDDMVYEIPSHHQSVQLSPLASGTCTLKVEVRGAGKSATARVIIK